MSYTPPKEVGDRAADILGVMTPVPARGGRPVGVMPIDNPADRLMRRAAHRGRAPVAAHLPVGGQYVHPFPRVLQWKPLCGDRYLARLRHRQERSRCHDHGGYIADATKHRGTGRDRMAKLPAEPAQEPVRRATARRTLTATFFEWRRTVDACSARNATGGPGRGSVLPLSHCQGLVLPRTNRGDDIAGH